MTVPLACIGDDAQGQVADVDRGSPSPGSSNRLRRGRSRTGPEPLGRRIRSPGSCVRGARRKSVARTGTPVESSMPGRSRNVYVRPPSPITGAEVARSGSKADPAGAARAPVSDRARPLSVMTRCRTGCRADRCRSGVGRRTVFVPRCAASRHGGSAPRPGRRTRCRRRPRPGWSTALLVGMRLGGDEPFATSSR